MNRLLACLFFLSYLGVAATPAQAQHGRGHDHDRDHHDHGHHGGPPRYYHEAPYRAYGGHSYYRPRPAGTVVRVRL